MLERARSGDQAAFAGLVTRYVAEIRLHCYRMLGSFHDAEDVTQEVLMRAWRYLAAFEGRSSARTWLYQIATNRCLTRREDCQAWIDNTWRLRELVARLEALGAAALEADPRWKRERAAAHHETGSASP